MDRLNISSDRVNILDVILSSCFPLELVTTANYEFDIHVTLNTMKVLSRSNVKLCSLKNICQIDSSQNMFHQIVSGCRFPLDLRLR